MPTTDYQFKTHDRKSKKKERCGTCGGTGRIAYKNSKGNTLREKCPDCGGTGWS